jgi:Uma2 family endonuclease
MSAVMTNWINRHRITVDEYYRMDEAGIFAPDARVELIEGEIIDMGKIGTGHARVTVHLTRVLVEAVRRQVLVLPQVPIHLSDISEPIPDFALVNSEAASYKNGHPGPDDTFLVIEVSDTSLRYDVQVKASLYARHGIPEYWIVDLPASQVRFFRSPDSGQYTDITSTEAPGVVSPVALPGIHIDLADVLSD